MINKGYFAIGPYQHPATGRTERVLKTFKRKEARDAFVKDNRGFKAASAFDANRFLRIN